MAETKIEWADYTFNPWRGCTKVSDGCANCYADTMSKRNPGTLGVWGPNGTRVVAAESYWRLPEKWDREADCQCGAAGRQPGQCEFCRDGCQRPRVFCASLADVFEDWTGPMLDTSGLTLFQCCQCQHTWSADMADFDPAKSDSRPICQECKSPGPNDMTMADIRRRLFSLIDRTPNLDWLLVTKRPENIERMMPERECNCSIPALEGVGNHACLCDVFKPRPNVWLGTSVENQSTADERIPHLLRVPAAVRFLSMEPLLGPVDLCRPVEVGRRRELEDAGLPPRLAADVESTFALLDGVHWVIVGGESGPNARPMHPDWVRSIRDQCQAAGVPFFFKQWGEWEPVERKWNKGAWSTQSWSWPGSFSDQCLVTTGGDREQVSEGWFLSQQKTGIWPMAKVGKKSAGRQLDGRTWDEVPVVDEVTPRR